MLRNFFLRAAALAPLAVALPVFGAFQPDLNALAAVPRHSVPASTLAAPDAPSPGALQFAVAADTALTLAHGRWDTLDQATAVWRLRVYSADAKSVSLHLAPLRLPAGAQLWIYGLDGRLVHGPYAAAGLDGLWTPIIPGDELAVEVRLPASSVGALELEVNRVFHGFRDWKAADEARSGSCNIDVACPQGNGWRDPIRSVARITVANANLCSGQLVNNVREDETPYFLTADHCRIGDKPDDKGPASSVVFYWNYETSGCGGSPDGDLSQTQSGAAFMADDVSSDFTLLRLERAPPAQFNAHFAGWSISPLPPQSGAGIHHPQGHEKRISLFSNPARAIRGQFPDDAAAPIEGWEVQWSEGVTEGGSSGSGLWDQNRRIVGVLSYGNTSCDNPSGTDVYGRLDAAWTAGPLPNQQLKAHLDPDNTGTMVLDGRGGGQSSGGGSQAPAPASYSVGALPPALLLVLALTLLRVRRPGSRR